jgi:hypothetical protein
MMKLQEESILEMYVIIQLKIFVIAYIFHIKN